MKASEELLAMRELAVVEGAAWFGTRGQLHLSDRAYWIVRDQIGKPSICHWALDSTHLEVIEMLERAVLAAMKEEE